MTAGLRDKIRNRAANRCEYCQLLQEHLPFATFHVEHIRPVKQGGIDSEDNLALSCHLCNLHKGSNLSGIDPVTDTVVELFNPRRDQWLDHFRNEGGRIMGLTPAGRATVEVMAMNQESRIRLRLSLLF